MDEQDEERFQEMNWSLFWLIIVQVIIASVVLALPLYWTVSLVSHAASAGRRSVATTHALNAAAGYPTEKSPVVWSHSDK